MSDEDTIVAIATPPGVGGIGIIRVSGPKAHSLGETLTTRRLIEKQVQFRSFYDVDGEILDHGLCLYFANPKSFTGEDVVEIQAHGGPILLDMLLERICELGARQARAGEFSERAFINDKLDLTQAEAIADLIESGSRAAARAAMRSLQGAFSSRIKQLVDDIVYLRAYVESALDFADEEIDFLADNVIGLKLAESERKLEQVLIEAEKGRVLNEGLNLVIAGLPNAGKSSLLNYLAGYEAAIVTDIPGTTRDVLREQISLKGIPVHLRDTAGLRHSDNPVEAEGVKRAWFEIESADSVLLLVDANQGITQDDQDIIDQLQGIPYQLVFSKEDLLAEKNVRQVDAVYISTKTGKGLEGLIDLVTGSGIDFNQENQVILARRRHITALQHAAESLQQAHRVFVETASGELMAEDLRQTQQYLNEITGEFTTEDLLGQIFSRFCIGK